MKLATRCIPYGVLPYENLESTTRMVTKLFEKTPFIAILPKISPEESLLLYSLDKIPGIKINNKKVTLKTTTNSYKTGLSKLDKAFNHPEMKNLEPYAFNGIFVEKYLNIIKKFDSPNAVINLLGPFTISQLLKNAAEEQIITDKNYRKLFIQAICVKALWAIEKIKEYNPKTVPIIMLEEPTLGLLGTIKREYEDVTVELVTGLLTRVIEKLKEAGAIVGVQCMEKCDWQIPINAGADIISFDAYNNPNNLCIIPEQVTEFLNRGGKINWGIVPVTTESLVKSLNIDIISKRLYATMDGLILSGVPENLVYNSALVSVQDDVDKLPLIFAEKALMLANQLAKRIPIKN